MTVNGQSRRAQSLGPGDPRARRSAAALAGQTPVPPLVIDSAGRMAIAPGQPGWYLGWNGSAVAWMPRWTVRRVQTSDCTALTNELVRVDPSAGTVNVTLPRSPGDGSEIIIKNESDSTNTINILGSGEDEIDGAASASIDTAWASVYLIAVPGGWVEVCCGGGDEAPPGTGSGWLFNDADNSAHAALTWD